MKVKNFCFSILATSSISLVSIFINSETAKAGFWGDLVKGKIADECIFGGKCKQLYDGYINNYYNPIRKYESEMSYTQKNKMSPLRLKFESEGNPCVSNQEWLEMVRKGLV